MTAQEQKTEAATPRRLRDARRGGDVARSADLTAAALLATLGGALAWLWPAALTRLQALLALPATLYRQPFDAALTTLAGAAYDALLALLGPLLLSAAAVAVAAGLLQTGPVWSARPLRPQLARIDPRQGARRLFGRDRWVAWLKTVAVGLALLGVSFYIIISFAQDWVNSLHYDLLTQSGLLAAMLQRLWFWLLPLLLALGLFDYVWQRRLLLRRQRMTRDERRREQKDSEGDPQRRGEQRQRQRELAGDGPLARLARSTLLVDDGALMVGLYYRRGETPLPVVTVIARGAAARLLLREARARGRGVVASPLATRLAAAGGEDRPIPAALAGEAAALLRGAGV